MYYKLIVENGHVGAGKSLEIVRYFKGENPVDVFQLAARVPRVKGKNSGTGVKAVQAISREEYIRGMQRAASDQYLNTRKKKGSRRKKEVLFH